MPELSEEKKRLLEKLKKDDEYAEQERKRRGTKVSNPDKFAGPIGLDDEGRPFRERPRPGVPEAAPAPEDKKDK